MTNDFIKQAKAVVIGHAVGDALGVPAESRWREDLDEFPITDMIGDGAHGMPRGAWSDDTSMSLCALTEISADGVNLENVMQNFVKWYCNGEFTPTGRAFGSGKTCRAAIKRFAADGAPFDACGLDGEATCGNGSLMRIHPFVLYSAQKDQAPDLKLIHAASALTHAHLHAKMACGIYAHVLFALLKNPCKQSVTVGLNQAKEAYAQMKIQFPVIPYELEKFHRLYGDVTKIDRKDISTSAYVVDTLEASVWCLLTTESYKECVLKAVNLGRDADTTAAVAGGLAGALYGYDAIPAEWRNALLRRDYIEELCEKAFNKI